MALTKALRDIGIKKITIHGMRASFRSWCGDTGQDRQLAEVVLAHAARGAVEAAYMATDLLERRRGAKAKWGRCATSGAT